VVFIFFKGIRSWSVENDTAKCDSNMCFWVDFLWV